MHVLPAIDVGAGVTDIRPGGATHLMLMQTRAAIAPGETGRLVLVFERAGRVETTFTAGENTRAAWAAAFPAGS